MMRTPFPRPNPKKRSIEYLDDSMFNYQTKEFEPFGNRFPVVVPVLKKRPPGNFKYDWTVVQQFNPEFTTHLFPDQLKAVDIVFENSLALIAKDRNANVKPIVKIESGGGKSLIAGHLLLRQLDHAMNNDKIAHKKVLYLAPNGQALDNMKYYFDGFTTNQKPGISTHFSRFASSLRTDPSTFRKFCHDQVHIITKKTQLSHLENFSIFLVGYQTWHDTFDAAESDTEDDKLRKKIINDFLQENLYFVVVDEYGQYNSEKTSVVYKAISRFFRYSAIAGYAGLTADYVKTPPIFSGKGAPTCEFIAHPMEVHIDTADHAGKQKNLL